MSVYFPEKKWFNNIYVYLTMLCQVCSGSVILKVIFQTISLKHSWKEKKWKKHWAAEAVNIIRSF